jgi:hypothetical protein
MESVANWVVLTCTSERETNVLEEHTTFIFTVDKSAKQKTGKRTRKALQTV